MHARRCCTRRTRWRATPCELRVLSAAASSCVRRTTACSRVLRARLPLCARRDAAAAGGKPDGAERGTFWKRGGSRRARRAHGALCRDAHRSAGCAVAYCTDVSLGGGALLRRLQPQRRAATTATDVHTPHCPQRLRVRVVRLARCMRCMLGCADAGAGAGAGVGRAASPVSIGAVRGMRMHAGRSVGRQCGLRGAQAGAAEVSLAGHCAGDMVRPY
jgi:hypothetical protein